MIDVQDPATRPVHAGRHTELHVLGSGSKGNAFALVCDGHVLLLDAGFSGREIERRLALTGLDVAAVVANALTHEHGDHACGATRLARRLDVPVPAMYGPTADTR